MRYYKLILQGTMYGCNLNSRVSVVVSLLEKSVNFKKSSLTNSIKQKYEIFCFKIRYLHMGVVSASSLKSASTPKPTHFTFNF